MRLPLLSLAVALLAGCATPPPPEPTKPAGQSATLYESVTRIGNTGANFFFVHAIDGKPLDDNSMTRSLARSAGNRGYMNARDLVRYLPPGKTRLTLRGDTTHAAPIDNLFRSGSLYDVTGAIDVELRRDVEYRVVGVLDAFRREVWLVEQATGAQVGPRIVAKASMPAPGTVTPEGEVRYTCCTLRYDGDWIGDGNWLDHPPIPPGTPILVPGSAGGNRAGVTLDGRPMRVGLDYGRKQRTMQELLERITTRTDPRIAMASWSEPVRVAARQGRVLAGMTREQVLFALGHPHPERTPSLDAAQWVYLNVAEEPLTLVWSSEQRLTEVRGSDALLRRHVAAAATDAAPKP